MSSLVMNVKGLQERGKNLLHATVVSVKHLVNLLNRYCSTQVLVHFSVQRFLGLVECWLKFQQGAGVRDALNIHKGVDGW